MANILQGKEEASKTFPLTQVYRATHDGSQNRLPFMGRSFISFSYGGKNIEDFNLLAYTEGDRMEKEAYASFEDLTSTYDTIHGQFYWGTYFHANTLNFKLATDGMTQNDLDSFKYWFRAGSIRELILAEHPNRAIMARIATPPQLHLLGFEEKIQIPFTPKNGTSDDIYYNTSTTVYRGEIDLELTMDEPFWYSIHNVLGTQTQEGYYDEAWQDANARIVQVRDTPDALKIIYEDHIPLGSRTNIDVFLGGDLHTTVSYEIWSRIVDSSTQEEYNEIHNDPTSTPLLKSAYFKIDNLYYKGARTLFVDSNNNTVGATIGGSKVIDLDTAGIDMRSDENTYLYYAGTAPSPVKLQFTIVPKFNDKIIVVPFSEYNSSEKKKYNTITLTSRATHEFSFTLPSLWLSYNQAVKIIQKSGLISDGQAWLSVREAIRDSIRHPTIRAWVNKLINRYDNNGSTIITGAETKQTALLNAMPYLLQDNSGSPYPATFTFDAKTGLALGSFTIRDISELNISTSSSGGLVTLIKAPEEKTIKSEENVGDMVRSSYLILDERNVLNKYFLVEEWAEGHEDYSYLIQHDVLDELKNLHFEFKNMYL